MLKTSISKDVAMKDNTKFKELPNPLKKFFPYQMTYVRVRSFYCSNSPVKGVYKKPSRQSKRRETQFRMQRLDSTTQL